MKVSGKSQSPPLHDSISLLPFLPCVSGARGESASAQSHPYVPVSRRGGTRVPRYIICVPLSPPPPELQLAGPLSLRAILPGLLGHAHTRLTLVAYFELPCGEAQDLSQQGLTSPLAAVVSATPSEQHVPRERICMSSRSSFQVVPFPALGHGIGQTD